MNSWTKNNGEARSILIDALDIDIILITETKLVNDETINLDGYSWYGFNRSFVKKTAKCGSGGVGILIRQNIIENYHVNELDKNVEGILVLELVHKCTSHVIVVGVCYMPPENSNYGRDSQAFYDHLLNVIYQTENADVFMLGGDFNARVGNILDFVLDIDDVPERMAIDMVKNAHGEALIEFLKEAKFCMLNGRVTPDKDDWTSVSTKGNAVVDYLCCSHSCLSLFKKCEVHINKELCVKIGYKPACKLPDHSIVLAELDVNEWSTGNCVNHNVINRNTSSEEYCGDQNTVKYRLKKGVTGLLNDQESITQIQNAIVRITNVENVENEINDIYSQIINVYTKAMEREVPVSQNKHCNKKFRRGSSKPWWNEMLGKLWKELVKAEKVYLKEKNQHCKKILRMEYKCKQSTFDKEYIKCKRMYKKSKGVQIESIVTGNPNEFWQQLKKLGPNVKNKTIPDQVRREDSTLTDDKEEVLSKWYEDFKNLYSPTEWSDVDEEFYQSVLSTKQELESNSRDSIVNDNNDSLDVMNSEITVEEVILALSSAKNGKTPGMDNIPNEILKDGQPSVALLYKLFNLIYESGVIPNAWCKSVIYPIPKSSTKDKYQPLNYRGISLLSNIYKVYTRVLNNRLTNFLEENELLVDEQNGSTFMQ